MELLRSLLSTLKSVDPDTLEMEYNMVRTQTIQSKKDLGLTTEAGALKENIKKNRYKDILPYDQSRVVLSLLTSDSDSDYINASFIKGASSACKYIAAQAPLSSTVIDFWRMIWQQNIKVIVMACREVEMGKKKCECYWADVQQSTAFGPFTVYSQGETRPTEDLVIRNLTVTYQQDSRALVQYQFLSWPDHDVPYEAAGVLDLLQRVKSSQGAHTSPLLIHCSAGCGRTGVILALDYIYDLLISKQFSADFSIMKIVLEFRRQRPSAVQTKDQYQFIYTAVTCLIEQALQASSRPLYCNLPPEQPKRPEKKNQRKPASSSTRLSLQTDMSDTYAVVNKSKHPHPPSTSPAYSVVNKPGTSRSLPSAHHYDNDGAPVYSTVRPRAKPLSPQLSATPIYDTAIPANHRPGEGPTALGDSEYHLMPADLPPNTDDDYEDVSSSLSNTASLTCSPGGIGFNCRVQKPRGPREPPAEWSRLER